MASSQDLIPMVRAALRRLYDPNALRTSPLVSLLGLQQERNPATRLREVLISAIEALEPGQRAPEHSRAWRLHEVLLYRYVHQTAQQEVAEQLGIGVRHLRREEVEAITALSHVLLAQVGRAGPSAAAATSTTLTARSSLIEPRATAVVLLEEVIPGVMATVAPLAAIHGVRLEQPEPTELHARGACVEATVLRQILINLLCAAVRQAPGGAVSLRAHTGRGELLLTVKTRDGAPKAPDVDDRANLDLTARLLSDVQGWLAWETRETGFWATVTLPAFDMVKVLLVDDNADTLRLLERYAAGSRYQVQAVASAERAIEVACEWLPNIIVLDVMMPDVDGWELLGRLRQHPRTSQTPLIVCTILAQEDLARSLGASGFIHKPITRQAFVAALEQQSPPAGCDRPAPSAPA
jgi:CheY-like chemotaxis protein